MRTRNILILFLFSAQTIAAQVGEFEAKTIEAISNTYLMKASDPVLDETMRQLFISCELVDYNKMDSLYILMLDLEDKLTVKEDSAAFLFNRAFYLQRISDYEASQAAYSKVGLIFEELKQERNLLLVKIHMANIAYYLGEIENAYKEYNEILQSEHCDIYHKAKMHHNIAAMDMEIYADYLKIGSVNYNAEIVDSIESHFERSLNYSRSLDNPWALCRTYAIYVSLKINTGNFLGAQNLLDSAEFIAQSFNHQNQINFLRLKKSSLYLAQGNYSQAIDTAQFALDFYIGANSHGQVGHAMSIIYQAHTLEGNYELASNIAYDMYNHQQEVFSSSLADGIQKYRGQFEAEKLKLKIREQDFVIEQDQWVLTNRNRMIWTLVIGVIAVAAFLILLLQRNKRKAQSEKDSLLLKSKEEGIKVIFATQEQERKRIAKDLHDGIVQRIGSIKLGVTKVFSEHGIGKEDWLIEKLEESTQDLRNLSHSMMPMSLAEFGLIPAIEDMLDKSLGLTSIHYEFEHFGIKERFDELVEIGIYRICQELVNNILKHSKATEVNFHLMLNRGKLLLVVEDNGIGMNDKSHSKGVGLRNITSRLDSLHGKINFTNGQNNGTLVTISIPIKEI